MTTRSSASSIRATAAAAIALIASAVLSGCNQGPQHANNQPPTGAANAQPRSAPPSDSDLFVEAAADAGVDYRLGHPGKGPFVVRDLMGSGVSVCDLDNDGHADIFVVAPQDIAPNGVCAKVFRNKGEGKFEDVTSASGVSPTGMLMGCAAGDVDGDGLADLVVTGYGVNYLYRNLGGFKFKDITAGSGLEATSPIAWGSSAAFADYDLDGDLDVFLGRYMIFDKNTIQFCDYGNGRKASCGPVFYDPQRGSLYQNLGRGKFKDATEATGFDDVHGKVLGIAWCDLNGDLIPDAYLANDEVPGDFFLSVKGKKYQNAGVMSGVALASNGSPHGGMGVDFADVNRDGRMDIVVTTFQFETIALYIAGEGGLYREQSLAMGLDQPTRQLVKFGTKFLDVENDGWPDIVTTNGHIHDNQEEIDKLSTYRQPLQLFTNQRGTAFVDRSKEAGPGFTTPAVGRGLAIGDLNDDGLVDVVVTEMEGPVRVLMNRAKNPGNWLRITLRGKKSNRMGLGSLITVVAGKERWLLNCTSGGSYQSSSDPRPHVGLGKVDKVDRVEVRWPSGKKSVVRNPKVPGDLIIEEPR